MDSRSGECRLCLDPFAECYTTIDSPELKDQMEKVFCFSIEPKYGYCSGVCQSCSYAISEFYQYSEKVRQNQELLDGNVTNCGSTIESKITLESVKVETLSDSELSDEPKNVLSEEETLPSFADDELYKPTSNQPHSRPGSKLDYLEADEPAKSRQHQEVLSKNLTICDPIVDSKITLVSVKNETLSDSGLPETTEDACEPKDEASEEEEVSSSGDDESYEPPVKKSQPKQRGRPRIRPLDDLENSKQTTMERKQKRDEEDQFFNKHFRMVCNMCGTSAETFSELSRHFRKEHKRCDSYILCCNKKLFHRYAIRDHIDFHANPDAFRCEVCGNRYKNKENLNRHMVCKHSSEDPFKCEQCPQSFTEEFALAQHMERHVKVKCPKCDKMFTKESLSGHMRHLHSGKNRKMVCDICGKGFLTKHWFDQHKNEHMGIGVKRFQCGICQRWLKGESSLRYHMNWVHSERNEEFQCDICQQKYAHSRALHLHKMLTHSEPKHECEFCGKKFRTTVALKEHRTTHTGKALYKCKYCGVPKNVRANLYQHIKRYHPTEWTQRKLMATQSTAPS